MRANSCGTEVDEISSIIIDGYNVIGIDHTNLSAQRDGLIRMLSDYRKMKGHDITVVFDGWKSGGYKEESRNAGGIKVIYSRLGENADSVIKRIICSAKKEWIVISSDRDITARAWSCGSVPVSSERFWFILENTGKSLRGDYESLDDEEDTIRRKGSSRTTSRKDKTLQRVLKKL